MLPTSMNAVFPIACVVAAAVFSMIAEAFRAPNERLPIGVLGTIGLVGAGTVAFFLWDRDITSFDVIAADNFGLFVTFVLVVVGLITVGLSSQVIERDRLPAGEYYALTLFAIAGMMLMAVATDLLVIFLALEILSLAVYVLTGLRRDRAASTEAAFKYFLLGGFSSAFFLYGIAFTYGLTGHTHLDRIGTSLAASAMSSTPMTLLAVGLLIVGFAFKVSAVPFHQWTPDAYEGAPTVVTGFMSTGVKAAAFAAFARVFLSAFEPLRPEWTPICWAIAMVTMIVGTVVGVAQTSVKRMLAYSSIAHAGYILVGIVAANDVGKSAILFYLLAYALTNLGAFGVMAVLGRDDLRDYAGLWRARPALAALMTVFLLSLGGFPPTAGFVAKWYIFSAAVGAGEYALAIVGVLTSVVSVFFYLRVVVMMYMSEPVIESAPPALPRAAMLVLAVPAIAIFYLGILPTRVIDLAADSIATIF